MSKHLDYKLSSLWTSVTFDCWPCSHGLCSLFFLGHPLTLAETCFDGAISTTPRLIMNHLISD